MKANKNQYFLFFGADLCVLVPLWQNLQNLNIHSKIINLLLYKSSCLSVFVAKKESQFKHTVKKYYILLSVFNNLCAFVPLWQTYPT